MLKLISLSLVVAMAAPLANAGPAERLGRLDHRLDQAERNGAWAQGSRADLLEDRLDRWEDRVDRREDFRDRAVDLGPLDRLEDRIDRRENLRDRRENRIDRRN